MMLAESLRQNCVNFTQYRFPPLLMGVMMGDGEESKELFFMDILSVIRLIGGIGLFLFGMSLMSSYLTKLAGGSLERILQMLTTGRNKGAGYIKGWGLGAGVTAIIQSSAATTIMLIGFVNAGIMALSQAIPVVMGANVGSTVTAQILRLGDLGSGSIVLQLLKPSSFAPMLVGIGAFIRLFMKKKKVRRVAGIMIGLGCLFYGMTQMEEVFLPLRQSPAFQKLFLSFENPIMGVLVGLGITALIQSSSASVGILQALSATGAITFATAAPIIIGQNIGKCLTVLIGGIGAGTKAKRVSASYLIFNIFGAVICGALIFIVQHTVGIPGYHDAIGRGGIADLHLGFNVLTSIILLPFTDKIADLSEKVVGKEKEDPADRELAKLDEMLLRTPSIALAQCRHVLQLMSRKAAGNYRIAMDLLREFDEESMNEMEENEKFIDRCETALSTYLLKINRKRLPKDLQPELTELLNSVSDFERIGDYSISIAYTAQEMNEKEVAFSEEALRELTFISSAAGYAIDTLRSAFDTNSVQLAQQIEPLEDVIAELHETIKAHHMERLTNGTCSIEAGVNLYDILNCYERIASHATNVALHIIGRNTPGEFDEVHGHTLDEDSDEYRRLREYYMRQYVQPVLDIKKNSDAAAAANALADREAAEDAEDAFTSWKTIPISWRSRATRSRAQDSRHRVLRVPLVLMR